MKKTISLTLVLVMLLSSLCSCNGKKTDDSDGNIDNNDSTCVLLEAMESTFGNEWYTNIDEQFSLKIDKAASKHEVGEICCEFTQIWLSYAKEYYDLIQAISASSLKESLITIEKFEEYIEIRCNEYEAYLSMYYNGGSIVTSLCSYYKYQLCRDRAIELYEIYKNLSKNSTSLNNQTVKTQEKG